MRIGDSLIKLITTFFYVGYLPFIPGTFGSLAGIFLFYILKNNALTYILVTFVLMVMGFLSAGRAEKIFNTRDSRHIVLDEVVGMLLGLLFLPYDMKLVVSGFFLFRLLDTLKPYPAGSIQRLHGSLGIMGDDIVAGIYTNFILQIVSRLYRG